MESKKDKFIGVPESVLHREGAVMVVKITGCDAKNNPFLIGCIAGKYALLNGTRFLGSFDREEEAIEALAIWDMYC